MEYSDNLLRLGTESAFEVLARAQSMVSNGRDIINLGIGQPDFKTADHIVEAGVKALRDGHHGYTPANGILPLREAVSEDFLIRHNVNISPENIIIMPGGKPTMFFCILMFGAHNKEIMYPNPGFPIYESLINYEIGLNNYLTSLDTYLDLVIFFSDRKDQQVLISTQVDPQDPNTFLYLTRNAAEGNNFGAELSIKKDFSDSFNMFFDLGLLKTKIKNYASRPDLEGREQAHAPSYSFSTGISWKISQQLEFILDLTGKSDFYYSDSHDNKSDSYVLTNMNLVYTDKRTKYNLWIRNLFDEYYSLRGFYFGNEPPNFEDSLYERHGDPRNLGLSIQYVF